jgi:hypothetical protein
VLYTSSGAAVVVVSCLFLWPRSLGGDGALNAALSILYAPSWMLAMVISGNVHDFDTAVYYVMMVLQTFLMIYALGYFGTVASWAIRATRREQ